MAEIGDACVFCGELDCPYEDLHRHLAGIVASVPCWFCGVPAAVHDEAACQAKLDAWQPIGILNTPGITLRTGIPDRPGNPYLGPHV